MSNYGCTVEVEGCVVGVTIQGDGRSFVRLMTETYTRSYEVGLELALKALRLNSALVRARFALRGGLIGIESANQPAFDATREYLEVSSAVEADRIDV